MHVAPCVFTLTSTCLLNTDKQPTVCQYKYQMSSVNAVPGAFIPQCTPDGGYDQVQCRGSVCYCVDKRGNEIQGTKLPIGDGRPQCHSPGARLTPCQRIYQENWKSSARGRYVPRCKDNGDYAPVQCHGPYCFCVDDNGVEIRGTKTLQTMWAVAFDQMCQNRDKPLTTCEKKLRDYTLNPPKDGDYQPICVQGHFTYYQCDQAAAVCWCVDDDGRERPGTRQKGSVIKCPRQNDPSTILGKTVCQREREDVLEAGAVVQRLCDKTGRFNRVQCNKPTNPEYCWCVDRYGKEIPRSRLRGPKKPQCDSQSNFTRCLRHRQRILSMDGFHVPPGVFVPVCKNDGGFQATQCSLSTGFCWCVDANGHPIYGTQVRDRPVCKGKVGPTKCHKERELARGPPGSLPIPGAFVPACGENGGYKKKQCHTSTAECWCVDKFGSEEAGTRIRGDKLWNIT
ncbi:hypothetical protein QZH41_008039 [Actinostola sp. cb2023]|nr:hypothetical protein QZH41_008039 [Actinostola sp. cb2023]